MSAAQEYVIHHNTEQRIALSPFTYKNKRGQTVHCDKSGMPYYGLRHRIHRSEATNTTNVTIDLFAHKQEGIGWRVLCVEHDHDSDITSASYVLGVFERLQDILSDRPGIVSRTGFY